MRSLRLGLVFWLALALVAGQQLVLWHDVGHARDHVAHEAGGHPDSGSMPLKCEQHFTCAQLSGALGSTVFAAGFVPAAPPRAGVTRAREASLAPRRTFLAHAPPASLA